MAVLAVCPVLALHKNANKLLSRETVDPDIYVWCNPLSYLYHTRITNWNIGLSSIYLNIRDKHL
jgi:hypothetical protein